MPRWGVHISIDQLGYPRASVRDVVQLASTLNRDAGLIILGTYNLALSLATVKSAEDGDLFGRLEAQQSLLRNCISKRRLLELQGKLGDASLLSNPLFHRAQLLTMIKLVAKFGQTSSGNRLQERDDFDVLAELGLLVNSLWAEVPTAADVGDSIAPSLAANLEIENPPSVAESLIRANATLGDHLDSLRIHSRFARRVERTFVFSRGMNFEELLDLTFAVWSYYRSLTVSDLIDDQRKGHFNPLASSDVFSGEHLKRILDAESMPFGEVAGLSFGAADSHAFLHDHTALKQRPFWKFGEDNYLCVDPVFLQEKLSSGVYWTVMNALDAADGVEFARVWGRLFERYLWDTLESIYPRERVWRSPRYLDNGNEAFDAVIDAGERLIVCQAKSTFVPVGAKYSGDPDSFFAGMESRFGDSPHAALRQIRENLVWCFGLEGRRPVAELHGRKFREILPVVVYQEPILHFGLVTRRFTKRLEALLRGVLFQLDLHVRPVIFIRIDDLDMLAQYLRDGDTSFVDLLHAKLDEDRDHIRSLDEFWKERFRQRISDKSKRNQVLAGAWKRYSDAALERFQKGNYL